MHAGLLFRATLDHPGGNRGKPANADGRLRRTLRLPAKELIRLNDHTGLHPALKPTVGLWKAGHLAVAT
jgi:hypothetical protein